MENYKKLNLKKNSEYKFCTCGFSKLLPFCDDSHKILNENTGSNFKSLRVIPDEDVLIEVFSKNWNEK